MAKQQLCSCITLFCTFLHDYHVKIPIFTFSEGRERKNTAFFSFFWTSIPIPEKNWQRYLTNWRRWNKSDKVLSSVTSLLEWRFRSCRRRCCLRWCYTRRFAMTIFSATQRCNIVATLFRIVTTLFQHWNAVFSWKSSLRIVQCSITLSPWKLKKWAADASLSWKVPLSLLHSHVISLHSTVLSSKLDTALRLHHSRTSMCDHLPLLKFKSGGKIVVT